MAYVSKRTILNITYFIIIAAVIAAVALYVVFVMPKEVTISFEGEQQFKSIKIERGEVIPTLPEPEEYGHNFLGWYYSTQFNDVNKVREGIDTLDKKVTLYPRFEKGEYTIIFDINVKGNSDFYNTSAIFQDEIKLPTQIGAGFSNPGKVVRYWCTTADGKGDRYDLGRQILMFGENRMLYAIWDFPVTTIYFITGSGASHMIPVEHYTGEKVPEEIYRPYATKDGYIFGGWYFDEECTELIDFDAYILKGIGVNFYAKWNAKEYAANFYVDGALWKSVPIYFDGLLEKPSPEPAAIGKNFVGWFVDDTLLSNYNFENLVRGHLKLYAAWEDIMVEDETKQEAFKYNVVGNNTVTITGIKDSHKSITTLVIPRKINELDVTAIINIKGLEQLISVSLPYTIQTIASNTFSGCPKLIEFKMQSLSEYFATADGILYSADYKILYRYPASKVGDSFITNLNTEIIESYAFSKSVYLKELEIGAVSIKEAALLESRITKLTLGKNVENIDESAFMGCADLITVISNSEHFKIKDGGIYNGDYTRLLKYFNKELTVAFVAPTSLVEVSEFAFLNCTNIISVEFHESLRVLGSYMLSGCTSLETITFRSSTFEPLGNFILDGCTSIKTIKLVENSDIHTGLISDGYPADKFIFI